MTTYAEKKRQKLKASKKLADTIIELRQQVALLRGGFLSMSGLIGVLLENKSMDLGDEELAAMEKLSNQLAQYQNILIGQQTETKDGD
jgi:hypothetical protein